MAKKVNEKQIVEGKIFALIAYLSIFCFIPLLFKRDNEFVLSHGKQGLILFVAEVATFILHIILGIWILRLGMFLLLLMSFFGMIAVLRGRYIELPIVFDIADQIEL